MPIDQKDLQAVFDELQKQFNAPNKSDYEGMRPYLHAQITWKMLHHVGSSSGIEDLLWWLKTNKAALNPQFIPGTPTPAKYQDGGQRMSGNALWEAQRGSSQEKIEYHFSFSQDGNGNWFLRDAWGRVL